GRHRGPREGPRRHGLVGLPRLLARAVGPGGRSGSVAVPLRLQPAGAAGGPRSVPRRRLPRRVRSGGRRVLLGGAGGGRGRPGAVVRARPVLAAAERATVRALVPARGLPIPNQPGVGAPRMVPPTDARDGDVGPRADRVRTRPDFAAPGPGAS